MTIRNVVRKLGVIFLSFILLLLTAWAAAALFFDVRFARLRIPCMVAYLLAVAGCMFFRRFWYRILGCLVCFLIVLVW